MDAADHLVPDLGRDSLTDRPDDDDDDLREDEAISDICENTLDLGRVRTSRNTTPSNTSFFWESRVCQLRSWVTAG